MTTTKIIAVSTFAVLLSACSSSQTQIEGAPAAVTAGKGPAHIHNIEGHGDFTHSHSGNSGPNHTHSWKQMMIEMKKSGMK